MCDDEGLFLSNRFGDFCNDWNDQKSCEQRTDTTMHRGPFTRSPRVAIEKMIDNDEKGKASDDVEGIEDKKGSESELTELTNRKCLHRRPQDFDQAITDCFEIDWFEIISI